MGENFCTQTFQTVQRLQKRLILLGKVEADEVIDRLTEEAGAGHGAHAHQPGQILTEGQVAVVAKFGNIQQDIVRSLRVVVDKVEISALCPAHSAALPGSFDQSAYFDHSHCVLQSADPFPKRVFRAIFREKPRFEKHKNATNSIQKERIPNISD